MTRGDARGRVQTRVRRGTSLLSVRRRAARPPARLCWLARVAIAALDACVGIAALDAAPNPKA